MIDKDLAIHIDEIAILRNIVSKLEEGTSNIVLVSGESGVGVTTCINRTLSTDSLRVLQGHASETHTQPFNPIIQTLRTYIRSEENALESCATFKDHLAILLPELGKAPEHSDQSTLYEAIQCVFMSAANNEPTVLFFDDLQWSDSSTLEWLVYLARNIQSVPLLVIGAYRSDEITRNHPIRRFRSDLRRTIKVTEIEIQPLSLDDTHRYIHSLLKQEPDKKLVKHIHKLTQGIPLYIKEFIQALDENKQLRETDNTIRLVDDTNLVLPETVQDVILLRLSRFSESARNLLEIMAVAGVEFELKHTLSISQSDDGLSELIDRQIIIETQGGSGKFRHALTREIVYQNIIWTRRQSLHLKLAEILENEKVFPRQIADHWLAGRDIPHARQALIESADEFCRIHAYRDAVDSAQEALNLWGQGDEDEQRLRALHRLAHCARLSGMFTEAIQALTEIAVFQKDKNAIEYANIQCRLANLYDIQRMWEKMLSARRQAIEIYSDHSLHAEAAEQCLLIANHLHMREFFTAALKMAQNAVSYAESSQEIGIKAQALAIEGQLHAKLGQREEGLQQAKAGLSLALDNQLTDVAVVAYIKLASVYENVSEREQSVAVYTDALNYCAAHNDTAKENLCYLCMISVYTETGDWDEAANLSLKVMTRDLDPIWYAAVLNFNIPILIQRGDFRQAKKYIKEVEAVIHLDSSSFRPIRLEWNHAQFDMLEGNTDSLLRRCKHILQEWQTTEEWLYTIAVIRFIATSFATLKQVDALQECASALASVVDKNNNPELMASLAYVLGEISLLEEQSSTAVEHFRQAINLFEPLRMPYYEAEIRVRLAHALVADNQTDEAIKMLVSAHQITQTLGAVTLEKQILAILDKLNASIEDHLGQRVANQHERAGLTKRQLEVLKLIADGLTNGDIAEKLVLSPRTVEMHVGNILNRLNCNSRVEAVRIAMEQELF